MDLDRLLLCFYRMISLRGTGIQDVVRNPMLDRLGSAFIDKSCQTARLKKEIWY
jgi:hypothetical protein